MESRASTLGLDTGRTLGSLWAQDLGLAGRVLAGWLAGQPAGRPAAGWLASAGWLTGWLNGWLTGWLAGSLDSPGQFGFASQLLRGVFFVHTNHQNN